MAAAQQGQSSAFGFADPALYESAKTSAVHDALPVTASTPAKYKAVYCAYEACIGAPPGLWTFDSQSDPSQPAQVTAAGYDTVRNRHPERPGVHCRAAPREQGLTA